MLAGAAFRSQPLQDCLCGYMRACNIFDCFCVFIVFIILVPFFGSGWLSVFWACVLCHVCFGASLNSLFIIIFFVQSADRVRSFNV